MVSLRQAPFNMCGLGLGSFWTDGHTDSEKDYQCDRLVVGGRGGARTPDLTDVNRAL